jgi:hypothetical protein
MRGSAAFRVAVAPGGALAGPWVQNSLWTAARAVPSLDLRFADNKSLVDATTGASLVTFTRASSGTFVGSNGLVKTAVTNLSLRSQELGDAAWTKTLSSITADAAIAPNGTTTADKLVEDSSTGTHNIIEAATITYTNGLAYTFSFFIKKAERQTVQIVMNANPFPGGLGTRTAIFNSNTGAFVSVGSAYTGSSVTAFSDDWYRVSVSSTSDATATGNFAIALCSDDIGTSSYTGNGTSGLFLWGAQLEQASTAGEYIPTTSAINSAPRFDHNPTTGESLGLLVEEARTNLSLYSEDFSNVYWTKTDSTITANDSTAPDGTTTADLWTNIPSAGGTINNSITKDATARTYTVTMWVKGTVSLFTFTLDFGGTTNRGRAQFNLAANTVVGTTNTGNFTGTSASITAYPDGWARLTMTTTTSTGTTIRFRPFFGTGGESVYIWGAQVEEGAFATSYIPTTTATVTRAADVASITGSNFGTTRTNLLTRSEEFDNAAWTKTRSSVTANAIAAPNGTLTGDKLIDSTDASTSHFISQSISFVSGTTYTVSIFAKRDEIRYLRLGFNATPFGTTQIVFFDLLNGVISSNPNALAASMTDAGDGWWRLAVTATATSTASDLILVSLSQNGTSISFTGTGTNGLYLWGAQLETSSAVTPYIPTTTATVSVFESSWYRQDEGTIFVEGATSASTASPILFQADDGTANERIQVRRNGTTNASSLLVTDGGTTQANFSVTGYNANTIGKTCAMYSLNDFQLSFNGTLGTADTSGTLPTVDRAFIGSASSPVYANGPIKRLTYWGAKLPNLQALTQP